MNKGMISRRNEVIKKMEDKTGLQKASEDLQKAWNDLIMIMVKDFKLDKVFDWSSKVINNFNKKKNNSHVKLKNGSEIKILGVDVASKTVRGKRADFYYHYDEENDMWIMININGSK